MTTRLDQATAELTAPGGPLDLGRDKTRLVPRIFRLLAEGSPVGRDRILEVAAELGMPRDEADALIEAWTERDDSGTIRGLGVTYNPTPHRMTLGGNEMWAWCAIDTLIFAIILDRPIAVESAAPRRGGTVRLLVSRDGVSRVDPAEAVITWPTRRADQVDISSTAAIWGTFCHHSFLFPSREKAHRWAAGRDDIEILTLEEGFVIAQAVAGAWLRYE